MFHDQESHKEALLEGGAEQLKVDEEESKVEEKKQDEPTDDKEQK